MTITINDKEYELATTLRVAYKVQGQHNHKPYSEVFASIGDMGIEQQIAILFVAFECANPNEKEITKQKFLDYYLDNCTVQDVMTQLKTVVRGILGKDIFDKAEQTSDEDNTASDEQGN